MCVFYAGHFKRQVVRLVVAHGNKKSRWEKKEPEYSDAFENEPLNSCRSLGYARSNKSISIFNGLCKPMELYIYVRKSTRLQVIPQQSTKTQTCGYRRARKNNGLF